MHMRHCPPEAQLHTIRSSPSCTDIQQRVQVPQFFELEVLLPYLNSISSDHNARIVKHRQMSSHLTKVPV
jgi:hypothetical protein